MNQKYWQAKRTLKEHLKFNNKGVSLVEVLVALGIVAIIGSATATLIASSHQSIKRVSKKVDENLLLGELSTIVSDKDLCRSAITTPTVQQLPTTGRFAVQFNIPGRGVVSQNSVIDQSISIEEMFMDSFTPPVASGVIGQSKTTGALWIKTRNAQQGPEDVERRRRSVGLFTLYYNNVSRNITNCFGASAIPPEDMCIQLGLVWDSITSQCRQSASQACTSLGYSWDGSKCVASSLTILGKSCSAGRYLSGYDATGNPICTSLPTTPTVVAASPSPSPSIPAPTPVFTPTIVASNPTPSSPSRPPAPAPVLVQTPAPAQAPARPSTPAPAATVPNPAPVAPTSYTFSAGEYSCGGGVAPAKSYSIPPSACSSGSYMENLGCNGGSITFSVTCRAGSPVGAQFADCFCD